MAAMAAMAMAVGAPGAATGPRRLFGSEPSGAKPLWGGGLWSWLETAYTRPESAAHRNLLEIILSVVLASLVIAVAERDPVLEAYEPALLGVEVVVLCLFSLDYVLHLLFAPSKLGYIFSVDGIVNLLSILPGVLLLASHPMVPAPERFAALRTSLRGSAQTLRLLRSLRFLRLFQIVKVVRRYAQYGQGEDRRHGFLVIQWCMIALTVLLPVLVADPHWCVILLLLGVAALTSAGVRNWLTHAGRSTMASFALVVTTALFLVWGGSAVKYAAPLVWIGTEVQGVIRGSFRSDGAADYGRKGDTAVAPQKVLTVTAP